MNARAVDVADVFDHRCTCGHLVVAHGTHGCLAMVKSAVTFTDAHGSRDTGPRGEKCPCAHSDTLTRW